MAAEPEKRWLLMPAARSYLQPTEPSMVRAYGMVTANPAIATVASPRRLRHPIASGIWKRNSGDDFYNYIGFANWLIRTKNGEVSILGVAIWPSSTPTFYDMFISYRI